jgi:hypothetical protein
MESFRQRVLVVAVGVFLGGGSLIILVWLIAFTAVRFLYPD